MTTADGTSQLVSITINGATDVVASPSPFTLTTSPSDNVVFVSGTNQVNGTNSTLNGHDSLTGGTGSDTLTVTDGGLGPFVFGNTASTITMTGFEKIVLVDTNNGNHTDSLVFNSTFNNGQTLTIDATAVGGNGVINLDASAVTSNAFIVLGANGTPSGSPDDIISTGSGNDVINGNDGDDRITGGGGADTLTGGVGNDTFVFLLPTDTGNHITDFNAGRRGRGSDGRQTRILCGRGQVRRWQRQRSGRQFQVGEQLHESMSLAPKWALRPTPA